MWAHFLRLIAILGALLLAPGCTIGTWPQPEGETDPFANGNTNNNGNAGGNDNNNGNASGSGEACDGVDDDGDGVTDEGCSCNPATDLPRDCVGSIANECATGTQSCASGRWTVCEDLVSTGVAVGTRSITVATNPETIVAGGSETIVVEVTVTPACAGVAVPAVEVVARLSNPNAELRATASDDGSGDDAAAGDGVYTATLTNLIGPAVSGQTITVEGSAILDREEVVGSSSITLEDAP